MTDINKFLKLSTSIGNDFSLVQGPGGNTSFKENESISIKKSGSYLKDSLKGEIFIKENLSKLKNFYNSNNTNKKYSPEMSIETPLHIIFDEKYVFHYHSMISVIISSGNNLEDIKELCTKLNITWIPYKRPGSLLSDEVTFTVIASLTFLPSNQLNGSLCNCFNPTLTFWSDFLISSIFTLSLSPFLYLFNSSSGFPV